MLFSISITTVMSKFSSTSGSRDLSTWLTLFIACSVMFFFFSFDIHNVKSGNSQRTKLTQAQVFAGLKLGF